MSRCWTQRRCSLAQHLDGKRRSSPRTRTSVIISPRKGVAARTFANVSAGFLSLSHHQFWMQGSAKMSHLLQEVIISHSCRRASTHSRSLCRLSRALQSRARRKMAVRSPLVSSRPAQGSKGSRLDAEAVCSYSAQRKNIGNGFEGFLADDMHGCMRACMHARVHPSV